MNETKPFWSTEPQDLTDRFVETVSPDMILLGVGVCGDFTQVICSEFYAS